MLTTGRQGGAALIAEHLAERRQVAAIMPCQPSAREGGQGMMADACRSEADKEPVRPRRTLPGMAMDAGLGLAGAPVGRQ
jgi:hypothetical protein